MKKLLPVIAIALTIAASTCARPSGAQLIPRAKRASHVQITEGPALESAQDLGHHHVDE